MEMHFHKDRDTVYDDIWRNDGPLDFEVIKIFQTFMYYTGERSEPEFFLL